MKIAVAGVCHSDLHVRRGEWNVPVPLVMGLIWGCLALGLLGYVLWRTVWQVPAYPFNIPGYVSIGWVVPGFGFVAWISGRSPEALGAIGPCVHNVLR